jgi:amino acid adenylation domain-containing protein
MNEKESEMSTTGLEIAVIGMTGRFPGAKNIDEFWSNLIEGRETIAFYGHEELKKSGVSSQLINNPAYVNAYGWLEDIEVFDSSFFGYTPLEAEIMDPQTRIFHECAQEALENAGYDPFTYQKLIGLYAGAAPSFNWQAMAELSGKNNIMGWFASRNFNDKDFLGTLIAHKLNLKGPALTLDTACSTSMVAIHLAYQGLLSGDCDMALAGAVTVQTLKKEGYLYQEGMIHSPDGHCRAFDANAGGSNFSNGAGIVILKRLDDAVADRDTIYAVIKGSFINNDGIRKAAYTAPSVKGQAEVIRNAYKMAEVNPETIGYVETHGTGTSLGDPVEIEGLKSAFNTRKKQFCRIGSIKSNVGHLQNASGVAGFIKTVLILKHRLIPPSLFFEKPNPQIDFENSPFIVNTRLTEWKADRHPRRAAVSSFGIGGTNTHVILEEWPGAQSAQRTAHGKEYMEQGAWSQGREYQLILLSAKTETALGRMTQNLENHFRKNPGTNTADAAYTLQVGRRVHSHRRMLVCKDREEAVDLLASPASRQVKTLYSGEDRRPIIFMFSGLGPQYVNMGRELYEKEPLFQKEMDRCFEILKPLMDYDLKEILYPPATCNLHLSPDFNQTEIAQPLVFIFEYALAKLLMHWGIKPHAMIGYSFGEYAAACVAGVLSPEDALTLVAARGKLVRNVPRGVMLSVPLTREELTSILAAKHDLSIAIDNGPSCIVSGSPGAVHAFEQQIKERKLMCMPVPSSHAFHSHMMEPALKEFTGIVGTLTLNKPNIPYISNVTGDWLKDNEAVNPGYWASHLRKTVRFADGMKELLKGPSSVFVEIGPGRDLTTLTRKYFEKDKSSNHQAINLVRQSQQNFSDLYYLLDKIGRLWLLGQAIDWSAFYHEEKRMRIPLPTYPFEGNRFWIDRDALPVKTGAAPRQYLGRKPDIADWFYIPQWTRSVLKINQSMKPTDFSCWLFFTIQTNLTSRLEKQLKGGGAVIITVKADSGFKRIGDREFTVNPRNVNDYTVLFSELSKLNLFSGNIKVVHLWNVNENPHEEPSREWFEDSQYFGFYSLIYLAKAIGRHRLGNQIQMEVITNHLQEVTGGETLSPHKATLLGAVKVIPQEYPNIRCRSIDIELPQPGSRQEKELVGQLGRELRVPSPDNIAAYRNNYRWVQVFESLHLEEPSTRITKLRDKGVYLITGGLGNVGFSLAKYLVKCVGAKLILTGRTSLPPREEWQQWLTAHEADDPISSKIIKVKALRDMGGDVLVFGVDISNRLQMQEILIQSGEKFGPINGVIHAAGDTGSIISPIENLDETACRRQFQPKIHGLQVLGELFQDKELDFCLLISSLSPILGGLGFAAYSAANTYMDTYVHKYNKTNPMKWTSVNWGDWKSEKPSTVSSSSLAELEMTPQEGIKTFERILAHCQSNQVIVSSGDLQTRIDQWVKFASLDEEIPVVKGKSPTLHQRPNLMTSYVAPRNQLEQDIAAIWEQLFGFRQVGVQDDFFELGGDSLKAITSISKMHRKLDVLLSLVEFFNRRTIEELAKYIVSMKKVKYRSIALAEKREYYKLSSAQKRLYILQKMQENSIAYNESQVVFQEMELDIEMLERTFKTLIQRHESLRTSFQLIDGEPVRKVHDEVEFEVKFYDISEVEVKVEEAVRSFIRPFDLSRAPLLRVGLIKLLHTPTALRGHPRRGTYNSQEGKEDKYILMVDLHHIITDGTSNQILLQEFEEVYRGNGLPGLQMQYKDYSQWLNNEQERWLRKKQEEYWVKQFEGELSALNLPTDFIRPPEQSHEGKTYRLEIGKEETTALNTLLPEQDATLYIKLLAIFYIFLFKLTGQDDIVVGTPTAGRRHPDLENIIGMFVNTLPMRNYPTGGKTCSQFLKEVRETTLQAFENQEYPFEELIETLNLERDMSRNPLFDAAFTLQNTPAGKLTPNPYKYENRISKFDLTLHGFESGDHLFFTIEYCVKVFDEKTIQRFSGYIKNIISSIIRHPRQKLAEIEIISPEEKNWILHELNDINVQYPRGKTLQQLFEIQVEKTPDQIVLIGQEGTRGLAPLSDLVSITYRELNERSNQLAHVLIEKAVEPDTIVAIMLERSPEMIIGILGILKAGSAYMPIDPDYPQERINYMLADSGATVLINTEFFRNSPLERGASSTSFTKFGGGGVCQNLQAAANPSNLAYVIYTSGTTGKPKGALIEHGNVVRLLFNDKNLFDFNNRDVWTLFHSYCFDFSVWEMYGALLYGGKLVLIPQMLTRDPRGYLQVLKKCGVTILNHTPSAFYYLIDEELNSPDNALTLRYIIFGGEALNPGRLKKWKEKYPETTLVNMYGITETTVHVTYKEITGREIESGRSNIGKPIPTLSAYVLDSRQQPLPVGIPGEICVGGKGVSRGYLNRPGLTAEKFVANPHQSAGRLYRSGDLARRLEATGDLEYLGRIDDQVQIRGFRVELGEIRDRLLNHKEIKEAVVVAKERTDSSVYLSAYFVSDKELSVPELRNHLSLHLPNHMIPSYFIQLEQIPLTLQGKLNRSALPIPEEIRPKLEATYVAPESDLEKVITQTWGEVIKRDKVGIYDNFFELGGTSLDIVKVNGKLRELLNIDVPVIAIFRYPTIDGFARYLARVTDQNIDMGPISKTARSEVLKKGESRKMNQSRARKSARGNYNIKRGGL